MAKAFSAIEMGPFLASQAAISAIEEKVLGMEDTVGAKPLANVVQTPEKWSVQQKDMPEAHICTRWKKALFVSYCSSQVAALQQCEQAGLSELTP